VIETIENIYVVMEHAMWGTTMAPHQETPVQEEAQIASFLHYYHEKGIIHLDLKVENILMDARDNIKLICFGLSARFITGQKLN
ncbi:Hypothetical predicted protein, partial [Marmota monax]